jgi:anthranilate phosphoribosyltransferase
VYEWRRSDLDQTNDPPAVGTVNPAEFGLKLRPRSVFVGGDAEENARRIGAILDGADDPAADMILLNAAAAMVVAGRVDHLSQGIRQARTSIVTGSARDALNRLRIASKEAAEAEATG